MPVYAFNSTKGRELAESKEEADQKMNEVKTYVDGKFTEAKTYSDQKLSDFTGSISALSVVSSLPADASSHPDILYIIKS